MYISAGTIANIAFDKQCSLSGSYGKTELAARDKNAFRSESEVQWNVDIHFNYSIILDYL